MSLIVSKALSYPSLSYSLDMGQMVASRGCSDINILLQVRLLADTKPRPCEDTLESCNRLSDSDNLEGKLTDGKLLATYVGRDPENLGQCLNKDFIGLHVDLPSTEWFEHGQILILMTHLGLTDPNLFIWPALSLWGEEEEGMIGSQT